MTERRSCDICGPSDVSQWLEKANGLPFVQVDEDGLWICKTCQKQIKSKPVMQDFTIDLDEKLQPLVGKSAGAICRTLELPNVPPYNVVIEAASKIAYDLDLYMSAWFFQTQ